MKKFLMCKLSQNVYHWQIVIFVSNILRETTKTFNKKYIKKLHAMKQTYKKLSLVIYDVYGHENVILKKACKKWHLALFKWSG